MTDDKLRVLLDTLEIQKLKATYLEICDTPGKDAATIGPRFKKIATEGCTGEYATGSVPNRDALTTFMMNVAENSDLWWHAVSTPRIEMSGDTAVARWTVTARTKAKGASDIQTYFGRYQDDLRRTPDGWRFTAIRFQMLG